MPTVAMCEPLGMPRSARGPADWARAAEELADRSPLSAELLERHGAPRGLRHSRPDQRFEALARAITHQQLSGRAASTIWGRVAQSVGTPSDPAAFLAASHDQLRAAGLSNAKARSLHDLAAHVQDGRLDLRSTARMADEDVVAALVEVRGIGEWSAQMFLISCLGRTDVWPTGDVGVRNGWAQVSGTDTCTGPAELAPVGDPFRPYRSVLAWWCWQEVDTMVPT